MAKKLPDGLEAIFVVDGSPDDSHAQLQKSLERQPYPAQLLLLARNFGSFAAIRAGLEVARGRTFAVMAADLQEPPSLVLQMNALLRTGEVDVVVGQRVGRADPWLSRLLSKIFWRLYRSLVCRDMPLGGVDMFACNEAVRTSLLSLREANSSLIAQLFWLGYRRASIPYSRQERAHGVSAWTFARKLKYLSDSIFSFTDLPLRVLLYLGAAVSASSGAFGMLVIARRLMGLIDVTGYSALILAIIFFGALNVTATALVGVYAWRTFENSKKRPLHLVASQKVFGDASFAKSSAS